MICNGQDETQLKHYKEIIEGPLTDIVDNPKAKALNMVDEATHHFLWQKFTKKPWGAEEITKVDIKRFKRGVKDWLNNLGSNKNWFQRNFYLPKRLMGGNTKSEQFFEVLGEAASYHQRTMKEGAKTTKVMMDGLFTMFTDKTSPLYQKFGRELTKAEYEAFQKLEIDLLNAKPGTPEHDAAIKKLSDAAGYNMDPNNPNSSYAGEVLKRFQGILDFSITTGLTANEKVILQQWNVLRADGMKALLNGAISARRIISELNDPVERKFLTRAMDRIQAEIDALLIQSSTDMLKVKSQPGAEGWEKTWENGLEVVDPYTGKTEKYTTLDAKTGDFVVGIKKYVPKYVIELTDLMRNVLEFAQNKERDIFENKSAEQIEQALIEGLAPDRVSNRLKVAQQENVYHSLDPGFYLHKYVHDVASFNFKSRVNHAYTVAIKDLLNVVRKQNLGKGGKAEKDVADYAHEMIDILSEIRDSAVNNYKGAMGEMDNVVRLINGFEYAAKLGFSIKSGLKNRTQGFWNWVEFGITGYWRTNRFYERTDRGFNPRAGEVEITNKMMLENQQKRFGYLMGEKGEAAGVLAAATGGSLDVVVIPKGFTVNKEGTLIRATGKSYLGKAADHMAHIAEISSKYSILGNRFSQQWAENKNRIQTFKMGFAHAFELEYKRYDYWREKLAKEKGKEPTDSEIYNAMENAAGNAAQEMVKMLHFDYDNWAKARILQGKVGKTVGQFQHFKFAFFDLNYRLVKDLKNDVKDFNFVEVNPFTGKKVLNRNAQKFMRMSALYSFLPGLFALFTDMDPGGLFSTVGHVFGREEDDKDFGTGRRPSSSGLIDNPIIEEASKLWNYMTADKEKLGEERYEETVFKSYYGKNPITANLGPFISDLLTVAELMDWYNQTPEEYEKKKKLNYDPADKDWRYQVARIFSVQGARTGWHTIPALLRGDMMQVFRIETGLYQPRWITKWRALNFPKLSAEMGYSAEGPMPDPFPPKKSKRPRRRRPNKDVLRSLDNF